MFTKSFFKFIAGFFGIIALAVLGATFSNRYFSLHEAMFANTEQSEK